MFDYKADTLPLPSLQVVFRHPALDSPGRRTTTPGFSLSWFIRRDAEEKEGSEHVSLVSTWKPMLDNKHEAFKMTVNARMAERASCLKSRKKREIAEFFLVELQ